MRSLNNFHFTRDLLSKPRKPSIRAYMRKRPLGYTALNRTGRALMRGIPVSVS